MYTATRINGTFHVTPGASGATGRGMRAHTKRRLLNLIMTNIAAVRDMADRGYVTITAENGPRYVEMHVIRTGAAQYAITHQIVVYRED